MKKVEIKKSNGAQNQYTEYLNLILKPAKQAVPTLQFSRKEVNDFLHVDEGCGFFGFEKSLLKKVFKGMLVIMPWVTHKSTGKIYHNN